MTTGSLLTSIIMANQHYRTPASVPTMFQIILLITICQLSTASSTVQGKQFESVIASNEYVRSSSTVVAPAADEAEYESAPDIYDDAGDGEDAPSSSNGNNFPSKSTSDKKDASSRAHPEDLNKNDYGDETESYPTDDNLEEDIKNPDQSNVFVDSILPDNRPDLHSNHIDTNQRKEFESTSTSRLPFVPSNLWRELFTKPGILVGIIGGVVIGMLSAILLVMFIIYRMRKKDEGSYALEEGPRKSPSHAYTRVSSREFFA